ncbi:MAG: histidine phosphatase family protein [Fuerstiella sp.]
MKTLILMRHSHAMSDNPAFSDHERPLTQQGCQLAEKTAALLANLAIDQIVCSSAARTIETAKIVVATCRPEVAINVRSDLYLAPSKTYLTAASQMGTDKDSTILLVGHNPGLALLICKLAGNSYSIPPSSVAVFEADIESWSELAGPADFTVNLKELISDGIRCGASELL